MFNPLSVWNNSLEPDEGNIGQWMENLYAKFQPLEQARWNQCHIDSLFYAGAQQFVNRNYGLGNTNNAYGQWYFNISQQPCNLVTGYQRQHRKNFSYVPVDGADPQTTDQYNRLTTIVANKEGIHEQFSKGCELSVVSGMVLAQPYLDFMGDDPAQGALRLKIWEYNSFMVDPYFRNPDMSDARAVWCQEYIEEGEAIDRFGSDRVKSVGKLQGQAERYGRFYFLPENYNMSRTDMMVLSYIWYKTNGKVKKLYSRKRNQFFDFSDHADIEGILYNIPDMEVVDVHCPVWKVAVVLNNKLMYLGKNPLGNETKCPFVPIFWNYEPHIGDYPDLRVRGLIRTMRDPQYLFNLKVAQNNDIVSAVINSGWKRKAGAVQNEDNLKKTNGGWDVVINPEYQMTDVEKIIPTALPESDLALAQQMQELIFATSGINMENWAGQQDKQISTLTALMKQASNLLVYQKYFDQWDYSLKLLGDLILQIEINNWNAAKVGLILQEEPSPYFYSKIFSKYDVIVEEALLTPTQRNLQAQQMLDINATFGREVIPASMIIPYMNIQGKAEIVQFLEQQEQQASAMQQEQSMIANSFQDAQLKELYSRAASNIARAREDNSRSESNLGLYEERLSMIERNRSMSLKEKQAALSQLLENVTKYGELKTMYNQNRLDQENNEQMYKEELEKRDVERRTQANKFLEEIMGPNFSKVPVNF
jgi:hypothetical protein